MNKKPLYRDKKFTKWTIERVAEALCGEWRVLRPELEKGAVVYDKKSTQISFKGEVNVALDIIKQRYPEKDFVQMYFGLSLSPVPNELKTHVLNTLDMALFVGLFPELSSGHFFTIAKTEPWDGSLFSVTAQAMRSIIEILLRFESCFHLLLDDEYEIGGTKLDSKSLSLTHHLNQVKAYRLAEIYGHPEKLNEAVEAIKRFAAIDELSGQRVAALCAKKPQDAANWLYTTGLLERLCK